MKTPYEKELEKELEQLRKAYTDVDRDLIRTMEENNNLRAENKELKELTKDLNLNKIKKEYQKEIDTLKAELKEAKSKITLQSKQRAISDEEVEKIKELRASGLSYRAIQKETGWSSVTINRAINGIYDN